MPCVLLTLITLLGCGCPLQQRVHLMLGLCFLASAARLTCSDHLVRL